MKRSCLYRFSDCLHSEKAEFPPSPVVHPGSKARSAIALTHTSQFLNMHLGHDEIQFVFSLCGLDAPACNLGLGFQLISFRDTFTLARLDIARHSTHQHLQVVLFSKLAQCREHCCLWVLPQRAPSYAKCRKRDHIAETENTTDTHTCSQVCVQINSCRTARCSHLVTLPEQP